MPCIRGLSNAGTVVFGRPWIIPTLLTLGGLLLCVPAQTQDSEMKASKQTKKIVSSETKEPNGYSQAWSNLYGLNAMKLERFNAEALRRAIRDLTKTFPTRYTKGEEYLRRVDAYEKRQPEILAALNKRQAGAIDEVEALLTFQREVLLANPLLDFDKLLVVRRKPL